MTLQSFSTEIIGHTDGHFIELNSPLIKKLKVKPAYLVNTTACGLTLRETA